MKIPSVPVWSLDLGGSACCVAALCLAYVVAVQPRQTAKEQTEVAQKEVEELEATASRQTAALASLQRKEQALRKRLERAVRLEPIDRLNSRLNRVSEVVEAVASSGKGTEPTQLKIDKVNPGAASKTARFITVPIRLAGWATYASAHDMLAELHQAFPDTQVVSFRLLAPNGDDARPSPGNKDAAENAPVEAVIPKGALSVDLLWYAAPADLKGQGGMSRDSSSNPS